MLTLVFAGIGTGAIYGLVAIQYNLVFTAAGIFNFAQAQLAAMGTFMVVLFGSTLHLPVAVVIIASTAACALMGGIEEIVAVRPLRRGRGTTAHGELVTTLGVAIMLDGIAFVVWGSNPIRVPFPGPTGVLTIFGGRVLPVVFFILGASLAIVIGLRWLFHHTKVGLACLATAEDRQAAQLRGINVQRLGLIAFAAAGALGGASAVLVGPQTFAVYNAGDSFALLGFLALAIGGYGSFGGALFGGITIGVVEAFTERYVGVNYDFPVLFGLLLVILMARPTGLFGRGSVRVV